MKKEKDPVKSYQPTEYIEINNDEYYRYHDMDYGSTIVLESLTDQAYINKNLKHLMVFRIRCLMSKSS